MGHYIIFDIGKAGLIFFFSVTYLKFETLNRMMLRYLTI